MESVTFENKENIDNYNYNPKGSQGPGSSKLIKKQEFKSANKETKDAVATLGFEDLQIENFGTPMSTLQAPPAEGNSDSESKEESSKEAPKELTIEELDTRHVKNPIERVKAGKMHFSSSTGDVAKGEQTTNIANPDLRRLIKCISVALEGICVPDPEEMPADVGAAIIFYEKHHSLTWGPDKTRGKPTSDNIASFIRRVFRALSLSVESAVMSWVYVTRLMDNGFVMYSSSWRSVLLAGIIVAAKVWNEPRVWNSSFLRVADNVNIETLNQMERVLLDLLKFNVFVSASTYATHYFKLDALLEQHRPLTPINKLKTKILEERSALSEKKARACVRRIASDFE